MAVVYAAALSSTRLAFIAVAPVIAWLVGPDSMASWALAVSIAPVFFYIFELGIGRSLARFSAGAVDETEKQLVEEELLSLRLMSLPALLVVAAIIAVVAWPALTAHKISLAAYFAPLCLFGVSDAISVALINLARAHNATTYVLTFRAVQGGMAFCAVALAAVSEHREYMFSAFALVHASVTVVSWLYGLSSLGRSLRRPRVAEVTATLKYAAPLTLTDFSWWLRGNAFVVLVAHVATKAEVSLFFLAALIATPQMILMSGVEQALAMDYYRGRARGASSRSAGRPYRFSAIFFTGTSIAGIVLLPYAAAFVSPELERMLRLVGPFYLASVCLQSCYSIWIKSALYRKKTTFLMFSSLVSSAAGLGLGVLLAQDYGYKGLALAYPVPFLISALLSFAAAKYLDQDDVESWFCFTLMIMTGATLVYATSIRADAPSTLISVGMDLAVIGAGAIALVALIWSDLRRATRSRSTSLRSTVEQC